MSYISASENVGYSGISQSISDTSCATQYKMAVEGVQANVEVGPYISETATTETYLTPLNNDNYYHSKFKIDPNELYTFQDSDIITHEITVDNTEDYIIEETEDYKDNICIVDEEGLEYKVYVDTPKPNDIVALESNVTVKKHKKVANGDGKPAEKKTSQKKDVKLPPAKVEKFTKSQLALKKESAKKAVNELLKNIGIKPKLVDSAVKAESKPKVTNSISNLNRKDSPVLSKSGETFLDVFKREQGLIGGDVQVKTEPLSPTPTTTPIAVAAPSLNKKVSTNHSANKQIYRQKQGRGPTLHEALQRIPKRVIPIRNRPWHAPEHELFSMGPLTDAPLNPYKLTYSSSDDDEHLPALGLELGCVEEHTAQNRGTRLALRRAALRRQVAKASTTLKLMRDNQRERTLATIVNNQLKRQSTSQISPQIVNHLLADRGMTSLFTSRERRRMRRHGWSGGDSAPRTECGEAGCSQPSLPCTSQCLAHITRDPTQRLLRACGALFADGGRCTELLSPLSEQPLCDQHQWKKDNYDKRRNECKPRKAVRVRSSGGSPSGARRRRRPPPPRTPAARPPPPRSASVPLPPLPPLPATTPLAPLTDLNSSVCSNSSAYGSGDEASVIGGLSETEFIVNADDVHELVVGEVGHVPADDILDPAVLSQIPDEAFTEFFNQAEGGAAFAESSELTRALEAVLDERALDTLADCVVNGARTKLQLQPPVVVEMSSTAPS